MSYFCKSSNYKGTNVIVNKYNFYVQMSKCISYQVSIVSLCFCNLVMVTLKGWQKVFFFIVQKKDNTICSITYKDALTTGASQ